jgi:hypothetical protein
VVVGLPDAGEILMTAPAIAVVPSVRVTRPPIEPAAVPATTLIGLDVVAIPLLSVAFAVSA